MLQKSTQSFEHNLDSMQRLTKKFIELNEQVGAINQKYTNLINLSQEKNLIEESGLKQIQQELSRLVNKMQKM